MLSHKKKRAGKKPPGAGRVKDGKKKGPLEASKPEIEPNPGNAWGGGQSARKTGEGSGGCRQENTDQKKGTGLHG